MAAFNSMVYRLCKFPLDVQSYMSEVETIKEIATVNGYRSTKIDELIAKHSRSVKLQSVTTLKKADSTSSNNVRRKFTYVGPNSYRIANTLKPHDVTCVFGNDGKLGSLLGNPKDKIPDLKKAGIYSIGCNGCNKSYVGQSRRAVEKRLYEHRYHLRRLEPQKSSVAKHMLEENHGIDFASVKLLKAIQKPSLLDAYESYYINKHNNTMNADSGPITSKLFGLH